MEKFLILFLFFCVNVSAQTLRINEFSNGPSGSKEWIELLVAPTSPTAASLSGCFTNSLNCSGWVIDDNDGIFSPSSNNFGSGFANGHLRFKNVAPWTRLPVGAIIIIYNNLDRDLSIPPDDPYDFNNDCVYVLPANHISLESCTTAPAALSCSTKLSYSDCLTYGPGNWNTINAANAGDGLQLRDASFNLVHGVVYGRTTLSSCGAAANMIGNSVAPLITTTNGANTFYAYNGLDLNGYYSSTNWVTGSAASATPGSFNNANNQIWIQDTIRKGCICDVTLNLKDESKQTIIPKNNTLKYKVFGNQIIFHEDQNTNINIVLISVDGKILDRVNTIFKGDYIYKINNRNISMIIVNSISGYGEYSYYIIKHISL
jgi:hypothetical protein